MVSCRFAHQSNAIWVTGGLGDFCHHGFLQEHAEAIDALLGWCLWKQLGGWTSPNITKSQPDFAPTRREITNWWVFLPNLSRNELSLVLFKLSHNCWMGFPKSPFWLTSTLSWHLKEVNISDHGSKPLQLACMANVQYHFNSLALYSHLCQKKTALGRLKKMLKTTSIADGLPAALLLFHRILVKTLPALLHLKTRSGNLCWVHLELGTTTHTKQETLTKVQPSNADNSKNETVSNHESIRNAAERWKSTM